MIYLFCNLLCFKIQVNNVIRPNEYESAIRIKERAREDIVVSDPNITQSLVCYMLLC